MTKSKYAPRNEHVDESGNDLGTPPTFEEFQRHISLFDQIMATGWVGYGEKSCHVRESAYKLERTINELEAEFFNRNRVNVARSFEEYAHSFLGGERGVRCAAGIADVVNDWAVVEVKNNTTRDMLFAAIGQVLVYRQAIDPAKAALIFASTLDLDALKPITEYAVRLGVEFIILHKGGMFLSPKHPGEESEES